MDATEPAGRLMDPRFIAGIAVAVVLIAGLAFYIGGGFSLSMLWALVLVPILLVARWIQLDARRRGMDANAWGRYAVWFSLITLVVYLIVRRSRQPAESPLPRIPEAKGNEQAPGHGNR